MSLTLHYIFQIWKSSSEILFELGVGSFITFNIQKQFHFYISTNFFISEIVYLITCNLKSTCHTNELITTLHTRLTRLENFLYYLIYRCFVRYLKSFSTNFLSIYSSKKACVFVGSMSSLGICFKAP